MGPSVSFPLSLRIAQKLPVCNSWEVINKKLPIPLPILYYFELIREALANTLYLRFNHYFKLFFTTRIFREKLKGNN